MCRLFITNKKDFYAYDKAHGIVKLMKHLEKSCGGHGNGYTLMREGHIVQCRKGKKLTNEEIYHDIKGCKEWDYVIYHTRIASSGDISDTGCHPFISADNRNALAMNGTISELSDFADILKSVDSELVFRMIQGYSAKETCLALAQLGVIFVGFVDGLPYAVKGRGDLVRWKIGARVTSLHVSELPSDVPNNQILPCEAGYIWLNGVIVKQPKKAVKNYGYYGNSGYYGGYYSISRSNLYDEAYEDGYDQGYSDAVREYEENGFITGEYNANSRADEYDDYTSVNAEYEKIMRS